MANHLRQQIREKIGTILTGLTTTGSNVFQSRVYPQEESKLPCLLIYTLSDSVDVSSFGNGRILERELTVMIEALAMGTTNLDDTLDTIAKEIEVAMSADLSLGNLVIDSKLLDTKIQYDRESSQKVGFMTMTYIALYRNLETSPTSAV